MTWPVEVRRKAFHQLSMIYLLMYAYLPRGVTLSVLGVALLLLAMVEFLRLRRPEINHWFLQKFHGIHRESEIMQVSGIFWTLLGCWITMVFMVDRVVGVTAIGILVFADTAASLVGRRWGKTPLKYNPSKTREGTLGFAVTALAWALLFIRPHGAVVAALTTAGVESMRSRWNDNFTIPLAAAVSIGLSFGGKYIRGDVSKYLTPRIAVFCLIFYAVLYGFQRSEREST